MKIGETLPFNGVLSSSSEPVDAVEPNMHFSFDGKRLDIFFDEPLDDAQVTQAFCERLASRHKVSAIIEGRIRPSSEYVAFHVSGAPAVSHHKVSIGVVAYWIILNGRNLKDVDELRFSGLCVDSFCPMTSIETEDEEGRLAIKAITSPDNIIDLGVATVDNREVSISAEAYWVYDLCRQIRFESCLHVGVVAPDYDCLKNTYIAVSASLRLCLGRGNVDLKTDLCVSTPNGRKVIGEFTAVHGRTYVPDEYDGRDVRFVRCQDVERHFGTMVSAFSAGDIRGKALAENREDAAIVTPSKVIELTSAFEQAFREVFPQGVEHGAKTRKTTERAKEAMLATAESLPSDARRIVRKLSERVEDDSLETRIRFSCKNLPRDVADSVFSNVDVNRKNTLLGKKIATMRNDIAHGNVWKYGLDDIIEEYKLLMHLAFAMRLLSIGIPPADASRLLRCMS